MKNTRMKYAITTSIGILALSAMSASAALVTFDGAPGSNLNPIGDYQPLFASDGITMTYTNVGLYNGGPDHTTGVTGGTNWHTFQADGGGAVQTIAFDTTVQLPSMWLTTFSGAASGITITADLAAGGTFTDTFTPTGHGGNGSFVWDEYTGLAGVDVTSLSLTAGSGINAQLDDLTVTAVPEPSAAVLLGLGGLSVALRRKRK